MAPGLAKPGERLGRANHNEVLPGPRASDVEQPAENLRVVDAQLDEDDDRSLEALEAADRVARDRLLVECTDVLASALTSPAPHRSG